jgi:hypothetical protein
MVFISVSYRMNSVVLIIICFTDPCVYFSPLADAFPWVWSSLYSKAHNLKLHRFKAWCTDSHHVIVMPSVLDLGSGILGL